MGMYGPPRDCKRKAWARRQVCANVFGLEWRSALRARMSCARVSPYKSVGCSFETILGTRLRTRCCDCSFVLAAPVQTSVGKTPLGSLISVANTGVPASPHCRISIPIWLRYLKQSAIGFHWASATVELVLTSYAFKTAVRSGFLFLSERTLVIAHCTRI